MSPVTRYQEGPGAGPGFLLWRLTLSWQRAVTAALVPLDLTHTQFVLLACTFWLHSHDRPTTQVDIAADAGVDAKTASAVLRRLEAAGLVERRVGPADSRARVVVPTEAGAARAIAAIAVVEEADETFFARHPQALRQGVLATGPGDQ